MIREPIYPGLPARSVLSVNKVSWNIAMTVCWYDVCVCFSATIPGLIICDTYRYGS